MNTFCYFLEIIATILLFSFGLHFEFTPKKIHHIISGIFIILWGFYITIASVPFPNIFFIPFIILFVFNGRTYLKLLFFFMYSLFESIVVNSMVFIISHFLNYNFYALYRGADFIFYSISCVFCVFLKFQHTQQNNLGYTIKKEIIYYYISLYVLTFCYLYLPAFFSLNLLQPECNSLLHFLSYL